MTPSEYERLLGDLASALYEMGERAAPIEVNVGATNRWRGESGFTHQIDVSVRGPSDVLLIECKYWNRNVPVEVVLAFNGRVVDLRPTIPQRVHPIIVTRRGFQSGAETYANHHGIELSVVTSPAEFALRYRNQFWRGILGMDIAHVSGVEAVVVRRTCATCGSEQVIDQEGQAYRCPRGCA